MSRDVGLVVPAFRPDVDRLASYVRALEDRLAPAAVRVELDAPDARTLAALEAAELPPTVEVATAERRRGKGAAVTAGFEALAATEVDTLAFVDADGSTPVGSVADVCEPVEGDDADLAVGSRRHPAARVDSHQTLGRRFLGDGFAWLARRLLDVPLYDYQCGAKALSRGTWERVRSHLYEPGFAWDIELVAVAAALEARIVEVPIEWEDQPGSTVDPVADSLGMLRGLLAARHRAKTLSENRLHAALDRRRGASALVERTARLDPADE